MLAGKAHETTPSDAGATTPTIVPSPVLEAQRLSGNRQVYPRDHDAQALASSQKAVVGVIKLCVDTSGRVSSLGLMKRTGLPAYDDKILREVSCWTYRPLTVEGHAIDACSVATFIYRPARG